MITLWKPVLAGLTLFGLAACGDAPSDAYAWVNWTDAGEDGASGTGAGITVTYTGDLNRNSTGDDNAEDLFSPWAATFTHGDEITSPAGGDILRMFGGEDTGLQTIDFSAPVRDPVFAIVSLGNSSEPARILFGTEIEVLTSGAGKWGGSASALSVSEDGMTLLGQEAYGLVKVEGTYERLSFEIPDYESDYGLQLAVGPAAP